MRVKTSNHKKFIFHSLKTNTIEHFEQELKKIALSNYEKFSDVHSSYRAYWIKSLKL